MRQVHVRLGYVNDLKAGLPISYLEFWFAMQDQIDTGARQAFDEARSAKMDPTYDIVELRGHWTGGNCDYVAIAQLTNDDIIELIAISFDIDPLKIDF